MNQRLRRSPPDVVYTPIDVTSYTEQGATQISLCLALSAVVVATHFALAYREVLASVRAKGVWGLFDVE